jgi:hypothetical protein
MKTRLLLLIVAFIPDIHIKGQLSTYELPVSYSLQMEMRRSEDAVKVLPALDMEEIQRQDMAEKETNSPVRFGYKHPVNYTLENSGEWISLPNGDKLWQLQIVSPKALSINLLYDKFWLPDGAKFFIYSSNKKYSIGAFTSKNNKGDQKDPQKFATGLVYGDTVILEYYQPQTIEETAIISIAYVVHGYRYINTPLVLNETSGHCQVNVNCSEGDEWQNEKNAVARIIINGNGFCSGFLINNTAFDYQPLFLTAYHCFDCLEDSILSNWSFYWNYESPVCSPTTYPISKSTTGARRIAFNAASDFALLRLTEDPRTDTTIVTYYLGWDRSGLNNAMGGVGIHHPWGDVKKIATYDIYPQPSNCFNTTACGHYYLPNGNFWKIYWKETTNGFSIMESGSSGSPLINSEHRVIGQLFGAGNMTLCPDSNCVNPVLDIANYGKLNISWDGDQPNSRLKDWLDPLNSGALILNGCGSSIYVANQTISSDTTITSCGNVTLQNITVNNGAKLTVNAPGNVLIERINMGVSEELYIP